MTCELWTETSFIEGKSVTTITLGQYTDDGMRCVLPDFYVNEDMIIDTLYDNPPTNPWFIESIKNAVNATDKIKLTVSLLEN